MSYSFQPELEAAMPILATLCPDPEGQEYMDVLALENADDNVEEIIKHFYSNEELIEPELLPAFLRSPYYVCWQTDPNGLQYRLVVIDNRGVAALYSSLARFMQG